MTNKLRNKFVFLYRKNDDDKAMSNYYINNIYTATAFWVECSRFQTRNNKIIFTVHFIVQSWS